MALKRLGALEHHVVDDGRGDRRNDLRRWRDPTRRPEIRVAKIRSDRVPALWFLRRNAKKAGQLSPAFLKLDSEWKLCSTSDQRENRRRSIPRPATPRPKSAS